MLNNLKSPKQKRKMKQIGRGYGSKKGGHTVGRGQKGQKSRSGYKQPRRLFEGGSMPLVRRIPKLRGFSRRGITSKFKDITIDLTDLNNLKPGTTVNIDNLYDLGLVNTKSKKINPKVLSNGQLESNINIDGIKVSKNAKNIIEAAGGKVK